VKLTQLEVQMRQGMRLPVKGKKYGGMGAEQLKELK